MLNNIKIILFGDARSGKSALREKIISPKNQFNPTYCATIGVDFAAIAHGSIKLQFWDLAGNSRYKIIENRYMGSSEIGIYCVDLSMPLDEQKISDGLRQFQEMNVNKPIILVGTKSDMATKEYCEQFDEFKAKSGCKYSFVTSVKNSINIDVFFSTLVTLAKTQSDNKYNKFVIENIPVKTEMECVLQRLDSKSQLYEAIASLNKILHKLPDEKYHFITNATVKLVDSLKNEELVSKKVDAIYQFETSCKRCLAGPHPTLEKVGKVTGAIAAAAAVTLFIAVTGFFVGICTGPGIFFLGALAVGAGACAGGLALHGFFRETPEQKALKQVVAGAEEEFKTDYLSSIGSRLFVFG